MLRHVAVVIKKWVQDSCKVLRGGNSVIFDRRYCKRILISENLSCSIAIQILHSKINCLYNIVTI